MRQIIVLSFFLLGLSALAWASEETIEKESNYVTQRLLIFNGKNEILLQRNAYGWSTSGVRFDQRVSIHQGLDALAQKYGVKIKDVALAGLFSYEYGFTTAISTRSHYRAKLAGGELATPTDMEETAWVAITKAITLIASDSQRSPPSYVAMMTLMLEQPDTIWGGAFHVWQEDGVYKSKVVEAPYALGKSL